MNSVQEMQTKFCQVSHRKNLCEDHKASTPVIVCRKTYMAGRTTGRVGGKDYRLGFLETPPKPSLERKLLLQLDQEAVIATEDGTIAVTDPKSHCFSLHPPQLNGGPAFSYLLFKLLSTLKSQADMLAAESVACLHCCSEFRCWDSMMGRKDLKEAWKLGVFME